MTEITGNRSPARITGQGIRLAAGAATDFVPRNSEASNEVTVYYDAVAPVATLTLVLSARDEFSDTTSVPELIEVLPV